MTRAQGITAVNCTSCGAGLDILGGGRVSTHVCGYCGAALDANQDYAVIARYSGLQRPETPLALGMAGEIDGVTFTVIGILAWEESWQGSVWTWVDHQVFSPTHGYAWLTVEVGHLIFSRRYRKPTRPAFLTSATVERAESRPVVRTGRGTYRYYETSTARITFAEGEFNWEPKVGDRATAVSALGRDAMLTFEHSTTEREVEVSTWLPPATYTAFGAVAPARASRNHPLMPYPGRRLPRFYTLAAVGLAVLAVIAGLGLSSMRGRAVASAPEIPVASLPVDIAFDLTDTDRLATIRLQADVSNSWAYVDVALTDPEDRPVFEAGREIGFYHGRDADGRWTEGTTVSTLRFHPPMPGRYTLSLDMPESGTWQRGGAAASALSVRVVESQSSGLWLFLLALVFGLIPGLFLLRALLAHKRRWSGSDWTDEDD